MSTALSEGDLLIRVICVLNSDLKKNEKKKYKIKYYQKIISEVNFLVHLISSFYKLYICSKSVVKTSIIMRLITSNLDLKTFKNTCHVCYYYLHTFKLKLKWLCLDVFKLN